MVEALELHPDRLFSSDPIQRDIAKQLYLKIKDLPIVSPHGHTDPKWFAENENFSNATELLIQPDHYLLRMLFSQGITMESLGFQGKSKGVVEKDPKVIWRTFANNYHLFQGTPTQLWLNHVFAEVFNITQSLNEQTADFYFDHITEQLQLPSFKPRALFERFNIEVIATTESPLDNLAHHKKIQSSD